MYIIIQIWEHSPFDFTYFLIMWVLNTILKMWFFHIVPAKFLKSEFQWDAFSHMTYVKYEFTNSMTYDIVHGYFYFSMTVYKRIFHTQPSHFLLGFRLPSCFTVVSTLCNLNFHFIVKDTILIRKIGQDKRWLREESSFNCTLPTT